MAKTEKEKPILKIDDKEYDIESMNDEQKSMINHCKSTKINLDQRKI